MCVRPVHLQSLAIQIAAKTTRWKKLSLYAVYKSVSFVQQHKLGGSVFKELNLNVEVDNSGGGRNTGTTAACGGDSSGGDVLPESGAPDVGGGGGKKGEDTIDSTQQARALGEYLYKVGMPGRAVCVQRGGRCRPTSACFTRSGPFPKSESA